MDNQPNEICKTCGREMSWGRNTGFVCVVCPFPATGDGNPAPTKDQALRDALREIEVLRLYGNKDCTAMADAALATGEAQATTPADAPKTCTVCDGTRKILENNNDEEGDHYVACPYCTRGEGEGSKGATAYEIARKIFWWLPQDDGSWEDASNEYKRKCRDAAAEILAMVDSPKALGTEGET